MRVARCAAFFALALGADAYALRTVNPKVVAAKPAVAAVAPKAPVAKAAATQKDVDALRVRLETVTKTLTAMLSAKGSAIGEGKLGPELKEFAHELADTLEKTKAVKDPEVAMKKLMDAKASMAGLTNELTGRQVTLMKEEETQQESLLLGVLMTRQKDSFDKQLAILTDGDFAGLAVSKALVAKHDAKTALYVQVAEYLDAHKGQGAGKVAMSAAEDRAKAQDKVKALATSFEQRVISLKRTHDEKTKAHEKRVASLQAALKKAKKDSRDQHVMQIMLKREERNFKKWAVVQEHDISSMEEAVTAIKNHDVKGLDKAREALSESIKSMQSKNSGFLVLAQLGHQLQQKDCPYCAAQCVDKCHQAGKSFTTCLTDCADAGKR